MIKIKNYFFLCGMITAFWNDVVTVEKRSITDLVAQLKNINPEHLEIFVGYYSLQEQNEVAIYLLKRYQELIVDNIRQNPISYKRNGKYFLFMHDVPKVYIEYIELSRGFINADVQNCWKVIQQKCRKQYPSKKALREYVFFSKHVDQYYDLLIYQMKKKELTNFENFLQYRNIFAALNEILEQKNQALIPASVQENAYLYSDFYRYLLRKRHFNGDE